MREPDPAARLSDEQRRAADAGSKPMMPVHGRPFLDYVLSALADAGISDVALVVAPDHQDMADHFAAHLPARVTVGFVVQPEALGTANAVLAAESWTAGAPFLAMNADNLYPVPALRALASLAEPGLAAFDRDDLVRTGNIPEDRVRAFALVQVDDEGYLTAIVEKPTDLLLQTGLPPKGGSHETSNGNALVYRESPVASAFRRKDLLVSMNCWRFDARIFEACRDVPRSPRGELELPGAVALAMSRGVPFKAIPARGPVLDLSRRADAGDIEQRLAGQAPRP
jgi:glucose-1-phosphate thymidylyltransferase